MPAWTDDRKKILTEMSDAGESVAKMAAVLGLKKGAVSGQLDRLGLRIPKSEGPLVCTYSDMMFKEALEKSEFKEGRFKG